MYSATLLLLSIVCVSCNNNDDDFPNYQSKIQTLSGVLTPDTPSKTVSINGVDITLEFGSIDSTKQNTARRNSIIKKAPIQIEEIGPFNSQGTPQPLSGSEFKNRKLAVPSGMGVPAGIYFGDVWETSQTITLPENAYTGRVVFNESACKSYETLARGVNWNMTALPNGRIAINWSFYTFVLNYNVAAQRISEVIPMDGADVVIQYYYAYIVQ